MTIRQVMNDVLALVSRQKEEAEALFYASCNRALDEIGRAFPKKATERIYHTPCVPVYGSFEEKAITPSTPLRISADGVYGFSFEAYGDGEVTVLVDGEAVASYSVEASDPLSLMLKVSELSEASMGEVTLSFRSERRLYLASVALYDCNCSAMTPYREYCRYGVSAFSRRFLSFDKGAMKEARGVGGRALYDTEDAVYIRRDADGIYEIPYLALPDFASADKLDEEIFLREDVHCLLVPLTAYYLAVEDENPAAELFLARYQAMRESVTSNGCQESVVDVYGW